MRALAVLLLLAMVWLALRLPAVERRFRAAMAAGTPVAGPRTPAERQRRDRSRPAPERLAAPAAVPKVTARASRTGQLPAVPPSLPPLPSLPPSLPAASASAGALTSAGASIAPPQPAAILPAPAALPGFDLATQAYAALATGDRRAADRLFGAALTAAGTPTPPHAAAWQQAQRRLDRHWSGDAYTLRRASGSAGAAASPVLGGGQSGGTLAWAFNPLASRPVAAIGRAYVAHTGAGGFDGATAQAAVGLRWQTMPGVTIAAERLIAIGTATSGDWNLRLAGGGQRRKRRLLLDGYGEAGVRGNGDAYAGGQARAMAEIGRARQLVFSAGPGAWGSLQHAQTTVGRLDLGAAVTVATPVGVAVSADWRWRVAGNAAPGSGPAVTVSAAF